MRLSENAWPSTREAIRKHLIIPESEQIDTVLVAAFLFAHVPTREITVWLTAVTPTGSAESKVMTLLEDHRSVHTLPDVWTAGYFLGKHSAALVDMDLLGQRVFYQPEMASVTEAPTWLNVATIPTQFASVMDGRYKFRTLVLWGPKLPHEIPGFIGIATLPERHYSWLGSNEFGARLLTYRVNPLPVQHWADVADLETMIERQGSSAENKEIARVALAAFVDDAIQRIDEFDRVEMNETLNRQLVAAVRLVSRVLGAKYIQDVGNRRILQTREMVRMFAFMRGSGKVEQCDIDLGARIVMSQLRPRQQILLAYAMRPENRVRAFFTSNFLRDVGAKYEMFLPTIEHFMDVGVLDRTGRPGGNKVKGRGYSYRLTEAAQGLARLFDPNANVFGAPVVVEPDFDDVMADLEG